MKHSRWLSGLRWGIAPCSRWPSPGPDLQGQTLVAAETRLAEAVAPPPSVQASQFLATPVGAWGGLALNDTREPTLESHLAAQDGESWVDWGLVFIMTLAGAGAGYFSCHDEEARELGTPPRRRP
ncbi:hypothetical protein [Candidatus Palauibacter sp.]|uniref:hypothetical protein n=1 Tax=Candidatus Palauibacter sp. TaxID=3101350 RepID=UPI003AF2D7E0